MSRRYSVTDRLLIRLQDRLKGLGEVASSAARPAAPGEPDQLPPEAPLDAQERRHAAGLMRINHAGEVAAQALYHGQALVSRDPAVRGHLLKAAEEERQHLRWCEQRLAELHDRPSRLQPLWYAGSLAIGAAAGIAGDRWSLGFVEETEKQVAEHLQDHLDRLPPEDARSRAVVDAMRQDEQRHGRQAHDRGARPLPAPVRAAMRRAAAVMKALAYRV